MWELGLVAVLLGLLFVFGAEFLFSRWFRHKERFIERMVRKQKGTTDGTSAS